MGPTNLVPTCFHQYAALTFVFSEHIPGARHIDFELACFKSEFVRRDLHPPEKFGEFARSHGINHNSHIVLYDRVVPYAGCLFAAKFWWLFKVSVKFRILPPGVIPILVAISRGLYANLF